MVRSSANLGREKRSMRLRDANTRQGLSSLRVQWPSFQLTTFESAAAHLDSEERGSAASRESCLAHDLQIKIHIKCESYRQNNQTGALGLSPEEPDPKELPNQCSGLHNTTRETAWKTVMTLQRQASTSWCKSYCIDVSIVCSRQR